MEPVCWVCAEGSSTAELLSKRQLQEGQGKERLRRGGATQLAQIYGPNFQFETQAADWNYYGAIAHSSEIWSI